MHNTTYHLKHVAVCAEILSAKHCCVSTFIPSFHLDFFPHPVSVLPFTLPL